MNINLKVFLLSVLASIVPIAYFLIGFESLDGWSQIARFGETLFIIVGISLLFGIAGFRLDKERRFFRAFYWLGISLTAMLSLTLLSLHRDLPFRNMISDSDKSQPQFQTQNHSPCEINYMGNRNCEEEQENYQPPQRKNPLLQ